MAVAEARVRPARGAALASLVAAAAVVTTIAVILAASFGTLIFSGPLRAHVAEGIALVLFSVVVIAAVGALTSSYPGTLGGAQDNTSIVLAVIAASIAASAPAALPADALFATVVAALAVATAVTGVTFYALGRLRLGELIRYIPYPVIGGFLAGTGWLLVVGGIDVVAGTTPALSTVGDLVTLDALVRWLPAVLFALGLLIALRRSRNLLVMPAALLGAIALFYVVLLVSGTTVAQARAQGWFLGPFPDAVWRPFGPAALTAAEWGLVAGQAANIATLVVIAAVSLLLNASGVEIAVEHDVDLNRELRSAGLANVLSGAGGGVVGYTWASVTVLGHRLGAGRRATGLLVAGLCAVMLLVGLDAVAYVPLPVVAAPLLFLGFAFLADWLVDGRQTLPRGDYTVVVLIVAAIAALGLLEGVVLGVALAVVVFVVRYSRTDVVKHALDGTTFESNVDRHPEERRVLAAHGARMLILELQGFVFFGTATRIHRFVEERATQAPPLAFLVLDFRRVSGVDSSAAFSFVKLRRLVAKHDAELVLTALTPPVRHQLERGGLALGGDDATPVFPDLDRGVEWCEDQLLATAETTAEAHRDTVTAADVLGPECTGIERHLERRSFAPGEVLIEEGQAPPGLFLVETGRISAVLDGGDGAPVRLRTMRPGTIIGELSYFLDRPTTARVVAETAVGAAVLPVEVLTRLERDDPELAVALQRRLVRLLAERLAATDRVVRALMR